MENSNLPVPISPKIKVVDETGRDIVRPDVIQVVTQSAQVAPLVSIRKVLEKQDFTGVVDPRVLSVTDKPSFLDLINDEPYTPWIAVDLVNSGAKTALIGINQNGGRWEFALLTGQVVTINRRGAEKRIELLFYRCNSGESTTVMVTGTY